MRYLKFDQWLTKNFGTGKSEIATPDLVVFEEVRRHLSTDSAHAYGGFLSTLMTWCERAKIPYQGVSVGTIKLFATGAGNADKETMIMACLSFGIDPVDDNEADAVCLLMYVATVMKKQSVLLSRKRVMAKKPRIRLISSLQETGRAEIDWMRDGGDR